MAGKTGATEAAAAAEIAQSQGAFADFRLKQREAESTEFAKVSFTEADAREKVVLVPNTSHAFSRLMASVFWVSGTMDAGSCLVLIACSFMVFSKEILG